MFSESDFKDIDISTKLNCVIMDQMDYPIMKPFKSLTSLSKKNEYNKKLNVYINTFDEHWKETLDKDFIAVSSHYMNQSNFRAENESCLHINTTPILLEKE